MAHSAKDDILADFLPIEAKIFLSSRKNDVGRRAFMEQPGIFGMGFHGSDGPILRESHLFADVRPGLTSPHLNSTLGGILNVIAHPANEPSRRKDGLLAHLMRVKNYTVAHVSTRSRHLPGS